MRRLEGRVALVTGGASGIGKATCYRFTEEGARVVLTDVQDEAGELVVKHLQELGREAVYLHQDVSSEEDWQAAVECALETYGALDILVNNAGIGDLGTIEDTTMESYLHTVAVTQHHVRERASDVDRNGVTGHAHFHPSFCEMRRPAAMTASISLRSGLRGRASIDPKTAIDPT